MSELARGLLIGFTFCAVVCAVGITVFMRRLRRRAGRDRRTIQRIRSRIRNRLANLEKQVAGAQRLAEVGTLTGGLAHEIKNPLSTVLLNLQLLQEELNPHDPSYSRVSNRLATVGREAARLRDILDDFLRYAGKLELRTERVDLNRLIEELTDFFAPQAQLNRVQLRLKAAPQPVIVSIDPRLIKQAVLNLMLNALQALTAGGEMILSVSEKNQLAIIEVIDTGPGVPSDAVGKIFTAYYSTKKGGAGLGLAMAKRIIEQHSGTLGVRSEPGKGSDFFIELPKNPSR